MDEKSEIKAIIDFSEKFAINRKEEHDVTASKHDAYLLGAMIHDLAKIVERILEREV